MTAPSLSGIHHLKVPVVDLDASLAWYQTILGAHLLTGLDHVDSDGTRYATILEIPGLPVLLNCAGRHRRARIAPVRSDRARTRYRRTVRSVDRASRRPRRRAFAGPGRRWWPRHRDRRPRRQVHPADEATTRWAGDTDHAGHAARSRRTLAGRAADAPSTASIAPRRAGSAAMTDHRAESDLTDVLHPPHEAGRRVHVPTHLVAEWPAGTFLENLALDRDGRSWLITSPSDNAVYRVDPDGSVRTAAQFAHGTNGYRDAPRHRHAGGRGYAGPTRLSAVPHHQRRCAAGLRSPRCARRQRHGVGRRSTLRGRFGPRSRHGCRRHRWTYDGVVGTRAAHPTELGVHAAGHQRTGRPRRVAGDQLQRQGCHRAGAPLRPGTSGRRSRSWPSNWWPMTSPLPRTAGSSSPRTPFTVCCAYTRMGVEKTSPPTRTASPGRPPSPSLPEPPRRCS